MFDTRVDSDVLYLYVQRYDTDGHLLNRSARVHRHRKRFLVGRTSADHGLPSGIPVPCLCLLEGILATRVVNKAGLAHLALCHVGPPPRALISPYVAMRMPRKTALRRMLVNGYSTTQEGTHAISTTSQRQKVSSSTG